jgi:hypothetical protein
VECAPPDGLEPTTAGPKAKERDDEAIERWVNDRWPKVKRRPGGAYNDGSLMEFLTEFHRHLDGDKVTLIWDGLPSHRNLVMQCFIKKQRRWLVVERLPSYAPTSTRSSRSGEPERQRAGHLCLDTITEAEEIVDQGLCPIGNETRLAFAFLRHFGLTL